MKKLLILLAVLLLTGCSATPTAPTQEASVAPQWQWLIEEPTGAEATKVVLELTRESLTQSLEFYFLTNEDLEETVFLGAIAEARSFEITSFSQEGDVVTAEVTITMPDLYAVASAFDEAAYTTAEEMEAALHSAIATAAPQQKQITMQFTAGADRWLPVMDAEVADAFYGGLLTYLEEAMEE